MTALIRTGIPRVAARVNWGRWVVDCPRVRHHALTVEPSLPLFTCWSCGAEAEVVWPAEEFRHGVERLLMLRPDETTRNWIPGETLHDLMSENAMHGVLSDPNLTGLVIGVDDNGIREDRLAIPTRPLREVAA